MKVLKNVLINIKGNRLQLADVYFSRHIEKIKFRLNYPILWEEINTRELHRKFARQFSKSNSSARPGEIDGAFLLLIPGAIDPHVHFDTPGFEFREDFEHASLAAAYGGVTTIIDMPCTSVPPVTSVANMEQKLKALKGRSSIDYAFWGGVSGTDFQHPKQLHRQIKELAEAGVAGFKAYFISGMEEFTDLTPAQLWQAAKWIGETGKVMAVHAEEKSLILTRQEQLQAQGRRDWQAYCASRDVLAEAAAVATAIEIARDTRTSLHVVHLSSARGLELIRAAKAQGIPITTETCPHYLFFTQEDFQDTAIRNFLKTAPPVKFDPDRRELWNGLADHSIEFVTTDHAGCIPEQEKSSDDFWQVYGGIPGVEHRVPFLFSEGFLLGRLSLERTIELLSSAPARFFGLNHRKGSLSEGFDADFALINLWTRFPVHASEMHSKGKYTPFEGVVFHARVEETFVRGNHIISRREKKPEKEIKIGEFVRSETNLSLTHPRYHLIKGDD